MSVDYIGAADLERSTGKKVSRLSTVWAENITFVPKSWRAFCMCEVLQTAFARLMKTKKKFEFQQGRKSEKLCLYSSTYSVSLEKLDICHQIVSKLNFCTCVFTTSLFRM